MATTTLTSAAETFSGGSRADEALIIGNGRFSASDTLSAGSGVDVLRWTSTNPTFDTAAMAQCSGWDALDVSAATSAVLKLTAHAVDQSDADLLTIRYGAAALSLDTSAVGGFGKVLLFGSGLVTLRNFAGQSVVVADGVDGRVQGGESADSVQGGSGSESLNGGLGDDVLLGGADLDTLIGGDGHDVLDGGAGADLLDGGEGLDVVAWSGGQDSLTGGLGSDTFVVNASGEVAITDFAWTDHEERIDVRGLDVESFGALSIKKSAAGAIVKFGASEILLSGVAAKNLGASHFIFAGDDQRTSAQDSSAKLLGSLTTGVDLLLGTAGADTFAAGGNIANVSSSDVITGGAGDDTLRFYSPTVSLDTALLGAGVTGLDRLDVSRSTTSLVLRVRASTVSQSDDDVLTIVHRGAAMSLDASEVGGAGTVVLQGNGQVTLRNFAGQNVTVADGNNGRVTGGLFGDTVKGGTGDDRLLGAGGDDSLSGGAGKDVVGGGDGKDRLSGGAGADTVDGGVGEDVVAGGAGDRLTGGGGVDTFVIEKGAAGVVTLVDRSAGERIDLRAFKAVNNTSELTITDTAQGAQVAFGDMKVLVTGTAANTLTAVDFVFAGQPAGPILVAAGTSSAAIQALINTAPAGAEIILGPGLFNITETLDVSRGDITIRGSGSDQTVLKLAIPDSSVGEIFRVAPSLPRAYLANVAVTGAEGATTLTLSTTQGVKAGDVIYVRQLNDDAWLAATGNTGIQFPADYETSPERYALREVLVKVTAVNGNTVTLSHPLPYTFEAGAATVSTSPMLRNVEIGGFTIDTSLGEANKFNFTNTLPAWSSIPMIRFDGVTQSSISDVVINDAPSRGVEFRRSFDVSLNGLTMDGAHNKGDSGNGYGVVFHESFASSATNLVLMNVRHAVLFSDASAEHYNTVHVIETNRDINFHGSPDADNTVVVDKMVQEYFPGDGFLWAAVGPGFFPIHARSTIEANDVTFKFLRASAREEIVTAHSSGGDLDGGVGRDRLTGGVSADTLTGGSEDDTLTGGGGSDRFIRRFGYEEDRVTDFKAGAGGDVLVLHGYAYQSFADVILTQVGADTFVELGQDGFVLLQNTQKSALLASNFQFVADGSARNILGGNGAVVLGGDGDDLISLGKSQLDAAKPAIGGAGYDTVKLLVGAFINATEGWGPWRGVEVLDLTMATGVALTFHDGFFTQADADAVTLKFSPTVAITLNVGAPAVGKLVLEGTAAVQLANSRSQSVTVSDLVAGKVTGGSSADTIVGGAQGDSLAGGAGNDRLDGRGGADTLIGGLGADTLIGGLGADRFVYTGVSDSTAALRDTVSGFSVARGDRIDLSALDAVSGGGNDAFSFVAAFTGVAGQLTAASTTGGVLVSADMTGDKTADVVIFVADVASLGADAFIL